jgi:Protein of unknown function (DUF3421)
VKKLNSVVFTDSDIQDNICVMTSDYKWEQSDNVSSIPAGAVLVGQDSDGDDIFVGRIQHEYFQIVASVTPKKSLLNTIYGQYPVETQNFEV